LWKGVKFEINLARVFSYLVLLSLRYRYLENDNPAALVSGGEELSVLVELHAGDDISCNKVRIQYPIVLYTSYWQTTKYRKKNTIRSQEILSGVPTGDIHQRVAVNALVR
jgi:hypothetical protein